MNMNLATLREIEETSLAESHRYSDAISVLGNLACNQAITWEEVERMEEAIKPFKDHADSIHKAASHAIAYRAYEASMKLPFGPGVAPLTAEEEALLEKAWNDYFNI